MHPPAVFEPAALRAHRLFESRDLDDIRDRISRVMQPHEVHALARVAPRPGAHMDFMRVGRIGLGTIDFGAPVRIDVGPLDGYHLLMFCLRGNAAVRAGGRELLADARHGIVCGAGQSFEGAFSADCEQFVVRIEREALQAHCGREVQFAPVLDLQAPALQAWLDQVRLLTGSGTLAQVAQRSATVATEVERLLVLLLLEGQAWSEPRADRALPPPSGARPGVAPGCVRRAEAFIESHAADPLRLADIAAAAGVPMRTLLEAFRRFRGHSPMQFLREARLDRAHALLGAGDPGTQVATVALDCGFTHFGRFAQAYRVRFGQSPSQRLAAARGVRA